MLIGHLPVVLYLALLAAVVLLVLRRRGLMHGVSRPATRTVWCPERDRRLTATLQEALWDGRRVDVEACEAFSPSTAVTCGKACLRITERPRRASAFGPPLPF
jgi:hypothetical protein